MAAAKFLETILKQNKVVVFSRNPCPYCVNVKRLFTSLGVDFAEFAFDKPRMSSALHFVKLSVLGADAGVTGYDLQEYIGDKFNHHTVPVVFVDGVYSMLSRTG
jgi:glutaredoxin